MASAEPSAPRASPIPLGSFAACVSDSFLSAAFCAQSDFYARGLRGLMPGMREQTTLM